MRYYKILINAIVMLIILLFLDLLYEILDDFVVGKFSMFSIRSWISYDLIKMHTLHRVFAIVVFSCIVTLLFESSIRFAIKRKIMVGLIALCLLVVSTFIFWKYLEIVCFSVEHSSTKYSYEVNFGSIFNMRLITGGYIGLIYCVGLLTVSSGAYIKNRTNGNILTKVFSHYNVFRYLLSILLPILLYESGVYWMKMLQTPFVSLIMLASGLLMIIYIARGLHIYWKVKKYYAEYAKESSTNSHEIRVSENNNEPSILCKQFWEERSMLEKLKDQSIYLVTDEIAARDSEIGISLDLYANLLFKSEATRQSIIRNMLSRKSVFHLAGCSDKDDLDYLDGYDSAVVIGTDLADHVSRYVKLLDFRRKQVKLLSEIHFGSIQRTNCIAEQLVAFHDFLNNEYDPFNVFDYCIKWLEIINYFYALIGLSRKNVQVSHSVETDLNSMSFGTWINFRNTKAYRDERLFKGINNDTYSDDEIFSAFNRVWRTIKAQEEFPFNSKKTISELFRGAKELRDCTRGHGVFTFEISPELNLDILTLLVGLINYLIDNHLLDDDFSNLEQNGWVIRYGEKPYFLYSHDPINKEYQFDSFQAGNSLSVPDNYREGTV